MIIYMCLFYDCFTQVDDHTNTNFHLLQKKMSLILRIVIQ